MSQKPPLSTMQIKLNKIFHDCVHDCFLPIAGNSDTEKVEGKLPFGKWLPPSDVHEESNEVVAHLSVPNVKAKDLLLSVRDGVLTIEALSKPVNNLNSPQQDNPRASFYRQIKLPCAVEVDRAKIHFENRMMVIRIPKPEYR